MTITIHKKLNELAGINELTNQLQSEINNYFFEEIDWLYLQEKLLPLSACEELFEAETESKLLAISPDLNLNNWKGLVSNWNPWENEIEKSADCELRLDKQFVLYFLQKSLGKREEDANFSCNQMTEIEKEIIENLIDLMIEKVNPALTELEINERNLDLKEKIPKINLIWFLKAQNQIGKLCLSLPVERIPANLDILEASFIHSIENFPANIKTKFNLMAGSGKITFADLLNLEIDDFLLLEQSNKNHLNLTGSDNETYIISININHQNSNWPKFDLNLSEAEKQKEMTKSLNNEALSDFPVEIKAEFKEIQITFKELLSLQNGSVLPIDKLTDNELFLTAQGKTIAKGELVVAGNKLGILIKEVLLNT